MDPTKSLSSDELVSLVRRVFAPAEADSGLALLVDLPDDERADTPAWQQRRQLVEQWWSLLERSSGRLGLPVRLYAYRNARRNNADLPATAWQLTRGSIPSHADRVDCAAVPFDEVFARNNLVIAVTELSATAPLKLAAPRYRLRAATMPGFSVDMIPALRLDYREVDRRVRRLAGLLDAATAASIEFLVDGDRPETLTLDLRYRQAHASGGLLHAPGTAGNLPSGEAYIVPYEGERMGDPSQTRGTLPVQFGDEVVTYEIASNRAVAVRPGGPAALREQELLAAEPAYGNLAELGLGVLGEMGVMPIGSVLLDEKLGLHIAFGRSDHFGGQVGAASFSRPSAVVHIDRVYLPALQPRVQVARADLVNEDGRVVPLIESGAYVVQW